MNDLARLLKIFSLTLILGISGFGLSGCEEEGEFEEAGEEFGEEIDEGLDD